ncbi:tripartite motif-containing protein 75-like [Erinaceus europaeus]|uniref:Tripartite motif-containing protein 75-like n=1 Tax=Erinaceus europaeus TaxID=9365 RepID=A0ABM3WEZ3_ERIEU|nr:tripartite motif-containing protein 75-like [Erinaceus europaeus]
MSPPVSRKSTKEETQLSQGSRVESMDLGPMEASSVLEAMVAESKCAICLDCLREPAILECGHNFCHSCLQQVWKEAQAPSPCPVCHHPCGEKQRVANSLLAKVTALTQLLQSSSTEERQQEDRLCEKHKQVLGLFCDKDLEVLCPGCVQLSPEHQGHPVRSVEEAAMHYRQMTSGFIAPLQQLQGSFQMKQDRQKRGLQQLQEWGRRQSRQLHSDLEHRLQLVNREQEKALSRLAEQEAKIQQRLQIHKSALKDQLRTTEALLQEVAGKTVMPDRNLLPEVGRIPERCEGLQHPALGSLQLRREDCSLPPLDSALDRFRQKFRAQVTLDPHTAHPLLSVSKDRRSVTLKKRRSKVLQRPHSMTLKLPVLGAEEFHAGRHYWEVQVEDKPSWAVGLCSLCPSSRTQQQQKQQRKKNREKDNKEEKTEEKEQEALLVKDRCWTIQLQQDGDYVARGALSVLLAPKTKPTGIGVYLDWELGQISFYTLNDRSHLSISHKCPTAQETEHQSADQGYFEADYLDPAMSHYESPEGILLQKRPQNCSYDDFDCSCEIAAGTHPQKHLTHQSVTNAQLPKKLNISLLTKGDVAEHGGGCLAMTEKTWAAELKRLPVH